MKPDPLTRQSAVEIDGVRVRSANYSSHCVLRLPLASHFCSAWGALARLSVVRTGGNIPAQIITRVRSWPFGLRLQAGGAVGLTISGEALSGFAGAADPERGQNAPRRCWYTWVDSAA